jgi:fibrillarin-like pre-rRNA processing protein
MERIIIKEEEGRVKLYTLNLTPGKNVYGEQLVNFEGLQYRAWDPYRSKLAAALLKGLQLDVIREGDKVLYLGTSTGTTASHISDIICEKGLIIGVEVSARVAREFIEKVAKQRKNVLPFLADARYPSRYSGFGKVDVVYCDIAQHDQTEIAIANCRYHLKEGGRLLLVIKTRSIDVLEDPARVIAKEVGKLKENNFSIQSIIRLEPFDKDHALVFSFYQQEIKAC